MSDLCHSKAGCQHGVHRGLQVSQQRRGQRHLAVCVGCALGGVEKDHGQQGSLEGLVHMRLAGMGFKDVNLQGEKHSVGKIYSKNQCCFNGQCTGSVHTP